MHVHWQVHAFDALTLQTLYDILRLRQAVFVVEQACAYLDLDGIDPWCLHVSGWNSAEPVAYLRIVPPQAHPSGCPSIGRICLATSARHSGLAQELVARGLRIVGEQHPGMPCQINAQSGLRRFYESFGFVVNGDEYRDEVGIPHLPMRRPATVFEMPRL